MGTITILMSHREIKELAQVTELVSATRRYKPSNLAYSSMFLNIVLSAIRLKKISDFKVRRNYSQ